MNKSGPIKSRSRVTQLLCFVRVAILRGVVAGYLFLCHLVVCGITTAEEDFSRELPRIPASDPESALRSFTVADGFEIFGD